MNKQKSFWEPEFKATYGYQIDNQTGKLIKGGVETFCTLHFYRGKKGESVTLLQKDVRCEIAVYDLEFDQKYIYTYDYEPNQSWTTYRNSVLLNQCKNQTYEFEQEVFYRLTFQRKDEKEESRQEQYVDADVREQLLDDVLIKRKVVSNIFDQGVFEKFKDERKDTVSKVKELRKTRVNCLQFILLSDSHYVTNGTWEMTAKNINAVNEQTKIDGVIHLGDLTDGMLPRQATKEVAEGVLADLRQDKQDLFCVLGNHDSNYFRGNPERFTKEEMERVYLGNLSDKVVRKEGQTFYYADYPGIRMIFLDSFDPEEQVRYGYSEGELDWLEKVLDETPAEMYVLMFSHVPPTPRLHFWSREIRGSQRLVQNLREFQKKSEGKLIGFIHGHNHADQVDREEGFTIISIGCAKPEYFEDKKPKGAFTPKRKLDDLTEELWDVMTISLKERCLEFTRFGAGDDRKVLFFDKETEMQQLMKQKKVITYGTFDLFHEGHLNLLKRAKALGDYLIVGITTEHFDKQRGKFNVIDTLLERIEHVKMTGLADEIIIEDMEGQMLEDVQKYNIDVFAMGSEWTGVYDSLKDYCEVVYLERTPNVNKPLYSESDFPIINMGIVGTGRIAPRFLAEAKFVSGINIKSVYNPRGNSAEKFGKEHGVNGFKDSYEEFLESVDAVYIASPHETHYEYAKAALEKGKHVLCEKPLVFSKAQARELFAIAKENKIVLMEGIKTAYCPGFIQIVNIAKSGKIGEIRDVEACFSRLTPPHLREMTDVSYGGSFMEFGSYTILPIIKLLGLSYKDVRIHSIPAENGVDLYTKIQITYENGMATSKTGLGVKSEGQLLISGTKGYILAQSPWWLTKKFEVRYEDPNVIETYTPSFVGDGLRYEISEFASQINGSAGNMFMLTEEDSVAMADIVERFLGKRAKETLA